MLFLETILEPWCLYRGVKMSDTLHLVVVLLLQVTITVFSLKSSGRPKHCSPSPIRSQDGCFISWPYLSVQVRQSFTVEFENKVLLRPVVVHPRDISSNGTSQNGSLKCKETRRWTESIPWWEPVFEPALCSDYGLFGWLLPSLSPQGGVQCRRFPA